jgi:membrane fusion protein, multidrug efflux system
MAVRRPMKKRMFIMGGLVLLLVAVLARGKFLQIRKMIASSPKPGPQTVTAVQVQALEWQPQLSAVGTLNPVRGIDVTTEIAGLVRSVEFKSGQEVSAGTLLVQLNADSDIAQLRTLQAAAELAGTVLARDREQYAVQAISKAQLDADEADVKAKRASVDQQIANVAKRSIRAPFAGKLGITNVHSGQYLNPGDKIVPLQTLDPIYADFSLPQKQVGGLVPGQSVTLAIDAFGKETFAGRITAINPRVESATRTVQIQATIPNRTRKLLPGMFANVTIDIGAKQRYLTLPQTAITYNPYGSTVFVLKPAGAADAPKEAGKDAAKGQPAELLPPGTLVAQQVFVTTGPTRGDQVAIVSGLKEGDQVVTSGQLKLKNGMPAVIDNAVQPANNPAPTPQEK